MKVFCGAPAVFLSTEFGKANVVGWRGVRVCVGWPFEKLAVVGIGL